MRRNQIEYYTNEKYLRIYTSIKLFEQYMLNELRGNSKKK